MNHARSTRHSSRRPSATRTRFTGWALGALVAVLSTGLAGPATATSSKAAKITGPGLFKRLTQGVKTPASKGMYGRVIVGFGAYHKLGSGVHDTLGRLVKLGSRRGRRLLEQHYAFLLSRRSSKTSFNRQISVLRQLSRQLRWQVDLRLLSLKDEMAQRVIDQLRKDGTGATTTRLVRRYLGSSVDQPPLKHVETDGQLRPRVEALRALHGYWQGRGGGSSGVTLGESVERFASQPYGDAERTITAAVDPEGLDDATRRAHGNRLRALYALAADEGLAVDKPPAKADSLTTPSKRSQARVSAKAVLDKVEADYAYNTVRHLPRALEQFAAFLDVLHPKKRARSQREALTHLLRLDPEVATELAQEFHVWLQEDHEGNKAVGLSSAVLRVGHLCRCVSVARALGMITWELKPPSASRRAFHQRHIDRLLGEPQSGNSAVDRIIGSFRQRNLGTVYHRTRSLGLMAQLLPTIVGPTVLGWKGTPPLAARRVVTWLVEASPADLQLVLRDYFRRVETLTDVVPAQHLNQVGLALKEIRRISRAEGLPSGIASDEVVLPHVKAKPRQHGARSIFADLRVADGTPDWVAELVTGILNQPKLGEEGRRMRGTVYRGWAEYLSGLDGHKTVKQAIEALVLQPDLLGPYLSTMSDSSAKRYKHALGELIDHGKQHRGEDKRR